MAEAHRLHSVWHHLRSEWATSVGEGMAGFYQRLHRRDGVLLFDQYVVGVESGDSKDRDTALGQGIEERGQHPGKRERKWAFEFEAGPRRFTGCAGWSLIDGASN